MTEHRVVSREDWEAERIDLLKQEKEHQRHADELAARRRELPWVRVSEPYAFDTEDGRRTLAELFDGKRQLAMYHFMFDPEWDEGCQSCSFWADNFNGVGEHLAARDVRLVASSAAPLPKLLAYRERMGWSFPWVSSGGTTFNRDFEVGGGAMRYNFRPVDEPIGESHGFSAFALEDGEVFHTYSTYGRGVEAFNGAYHMLDLMPRGRDEEGLSWSMAWLHRHDAYPE